MKLSLIIFITFFSISVHAINFQVFDNCDSTPLFDKKINVDTSKNLGEITVQILKDNGLPFSGSSHGIDSINGSPTGNAAMEIVNGVELRVFGLCYSVNDEVLFDYPDLYNIDQNDTVKWFFAYALFKDQEWGAMCSPAYNLISSSLCD